MKRRKYSKKRLLALVMATVMGIGSVQGLPYGEQGKGYVRERGQHYHSG